MCCRYIPCKTKVLANVPDRFEGFDNRRPRHLTDGDLDEPIVPNIVHVIRMGEGSDEVRPEEAACISAALRYVKVKVGVKVSVKVKRNSNVTLCPCMRVTRVEHFVFIAEQNNSFTTIFF